MKQFPSCFFLPVLTISMITISCFYLLLFVSFVLIILSLRTSVKQDDELIV